MHQAGRLIVRVSVPEGDEEEFDMLTRQLLGEIRESGTVDMAELAQSPSAVRGAKSGGLIQAGQLVLAIAPAAIPALIAMLRGWSSRARSVPVKVALKLDHAEIDLEYPVGTMTHDDLMELVAAVARPAPRAEGGGTARV